jgi:three-Cys-motif partner protein
VVTSYIEPKTPSFSWRDWEKGQLPPLAEHSRKKLQLLQDYVVLYLQIVCRNIGGKEVQPITFVDGFAGGATYANNEFGSPIMLLRAVREAEAAINLDRSRKPIRIDAKFYFVEKDRRAFACLEHTVRASEFADQVGKGIELLSGDFVGFADKIVSDIRRRHPRGGGRAIFFLDQCGYVQVPPSLIRKIHSDLNGKSEFIVNFAIDWLSDFLSDSDGFRKIVDYLDIASHVQLQELLDLKQTLKDWRYPVESRIGHALQAATGLPFFSPFYIEPEDNHRGYWLLHLAPHSRARSAMTSIHWKVCNRSRHYGPRGFDILAYKPDIEQSLYLNGMSFNDESRSKCKELLVSDLGREVHDHFCHGVDAETLGVYCCNRTVADEAMFEDVIWALVDHDEIEIVRPGGRPKRARVLAQDDIIRPNRQILLPGMGRPS